MIIELDGDEKCCISETVDNIEEVNVLNMPAICEQSTRLVSLEHSKSGEVCVVFCVMFRRKEATARRI